MQTASRSDLIGQPCFEGACRSPLLSITIFYNHLWSMSLFRASSNYANLQFRALKKAALRRYLSTKSCDPLRILFCGSDELSIASLRALHKEHVDNPGAVKSIDVVCRAGKRAGRGLKAIREGATCSARLESSRSHATSPYQIRSSAIRTSCP